MPGPFISPTQRDQALTTNAQLTSGQQTFADRLAGLTGLNLQVVAAWLLAEESGGAAQARQQAGNNDWLNVGYTDKGTYGASDKIWSDPTTAANATAAWLQGQASIPGYGTASQGVRSILQSVGKSPQEQVAAIQRSGWASGGYPNLPSLYSHVANNPVSNAVQAPFNAIGSAASGAANAVSNTVNAIPNAITGVFNSIVADAKYAAVLAGVIALGVMLIYKAFSGGSSRPRIIPVPA